MPDRRIFPTRPGWFALATPFVLGIAAINAGNNLLFLLLGACLGAIVISGIMSERALSGIRVDIDALGHIRAGERGRFWLRFRRTLYEPGDNPAFGLRVKERGTWRDRRKNADLLSALIPRIDGANGKLLASRTFETRGRHELRPLELSTIYPFGLLKKSKDIDTRTRLLVWPRVVPIPKLLESPAGIIRGDGRGRNRGLGTELYGIRERQAHDPDSRIHAKRSMALGRLVVIETEDQERPKASLGIFNDSRANPEAFERSLELATEVILAWTRSGHAVEVCVGPRVYSPAQYDVDTILDEIAVLTLEDQSANSKRLNPSAVWLVPEGVIRPPGLLSCLSVDALGDVQRC